MLGISSSHVDNRAAARLAMLYCQAGFLDGGTWRCAAQLKLHTMTSIIERLLVQAGRSFVGRCPGLSRARKDGGAHGPAAPPACRYAGAATERWVMCETFEHAGAGTEPPPVQLGAPLAAERLPSPDIGVGVGGQTSFPFNEQPPCKPSFRSSMWPKLCTSSIRRHHHGGRPARGVYRLAGRRVGLLWRPRCPAPDAHSPRLKVALTSRSGTGLCGGSPAPRKRQPV